MLSSNKISGPLFSELARKKLIQNALKNKKDFPTFRGSKGDDGDDGKGGDNGILSTKPRIITNSTQTQVSQTAPTYIPPPPPPPIDTYDNDNDNFDNSYPLPPIPTFENTLQPSEIQYNSIPLQTNIGDLFE